MEAKENIEKVLLEFKIIIEAQQIEIEKKLQKEKTLKVVDGTADYIEALRDIKLEFNKILSMIEKITNVRDRQYFIDAIREKIRLLHFEYNRCRDYDKEREALKKMLAQLDPFISPAQKEFEKTFFKDFKGEIQYDSTRLSFREFSDEIENYMSLSASFSNFSAKMAENHQNLEKIFNEIQLYLRLINRSESSHFHRFACKFFNAKVEFRRLARKIDKFIAAFEPNLLDDLDKELSLKSHKTPTTKLSEPLSASFPSLPQAKEDSEAEETEHESLEQLLALLPKKERASIKENKPKKFVQKKPCQIKVKHESTATWQERRLDGCARLLHRTLLSLYQKPGAVSITIEPKSKQLLVSTANNLDKKIIIEAITNITQSVDKLEKNLVDRKISLEDHIIERTKRLKGLNKKLKDPKQKFDMVSMDRYTPSEYQKFIFLIKNVRMDLDLAKFLQATKKMKSNSRYFPDLHRALIKKHISIVENLNLLHPEQAIADFLFKNSREKITLYIGSTIKTCKKCHVLFNGQHSKLNGLNQSSSLVQVKTSGFFNYGYPNTYLPAYTFKLNSSLDETEINHLLDQASVPSRKVDPRVLLIDQQPDLSDSESELALKSTYS